MNRWRRERPPADVLSRLTLAPGERPLAWARDRDDRWYVGTDRALHLADGAGFRRLGWEEIERADWQRESQQLAVVEAADWGEAERRNEIAMAEPGELVDLLRERVTRSVLTTAYVKVRGRAGISVVARRSPVSDGPVHWSFVLAEGLDPDDPDVADAAASLQRSMASELAGL